MQNVAQLVNQQFLEGLRVRWIRAFGVNGGRIGLGTVEILKCRRFHEFPRLALVPGSSSINLAVIAFSCRIVEELIDELGCGRDLSNTKGGLAHTFQRETEGAHMGDFSCLQQVEQARAERRLAYHAEWPSPRPIPKSFGGMHAVAHRRARQGGRLAAHAHRTMQIVPSLRASTLTLCRSAIATLVRSP